MPPLNSPIGGRCELLIPNWSSLVRFACNFSRTPREYQFRNPLFNQSSLPSKVLVGNRTLARHPTASPPMLCTLSIPNEALNSPLANSPGSTSFPSSHLMSLVAYPHPTVIDCTGSNLLVGVMPIGLDDMRTFSSFPRIHSS